MFKADLSILGLFLSILGLFLNVFVRLFSISVHLFSTFTLVQYFRTLVQRVCMTTNGSIKNPWGPTLGSPGGRRPTPPPT